MPGTGKKARGAAQRPDFQEGPVFQLNPNERLQSIRSQLIGSEKGGLFSKNSEKFENVVEGVNRVCRMLNQQPKGETARDGLMDILENYQLLIQDCNKYLNRHAFTNAGEHRQDLVSVLLRMAEQDVEGLRAVSAQVDALPREDQGMTVNELLLRARTKNITMGKSDAEHAHAGGKASRLTVLDEESDGASGFFKDEDVLTVFDNMQARMLYLMPKARGAAPIEDSDYENIREAIQNSVKENYSTSNANNDLLVAMYQSGIKNLFKDKAVFEFISVLCSMAAGAHLTQDNLKQRGLLNLELKAGDVFNMTNRNVATTRMADLFGLGHLVARSETVNLHGPDGTSRRGNLMQKAKGKVAGDAQAEIREALYDEGKSDSKATKGLSAPKISGTFQQQLSSLQVLDYICGQIDRHQDNYFVQIDEKTGQLTGVQGIDNDLSFGNAISFGTDYGQNGRSIMDETTNSLIIPHMCAELAERILVVTPEMVKFTIGPLLEPENVDRVCHRLTGLQEAVRKEKGDKSSKRFVSQSGWGAETLKDFASQKSTAPAGGSGNYIGQFMYQSEATGNVASKRAAAQKKKEMWDACISAGYIVPGDKKKTVAYLNQVCQVGNTGAEKDEQIKAQSELKLMINLLEAGKDDQVPDYAAMSYNKVPSYILNCITSKKI